MPLDPTSLKLKVLESPGELCPGRFFGLEPDDGYQFEIERVVHWGDRSDLTLCFSVRLRGLEHPVLVRFFPRVSAVTSGWSLHGAQTYWISVP